MQRRCRGRCTGIELERVQQEANDQPIFVKCGLGDLPYMLLCWVLGCELARPRTRRKDMLTKVEKYLAENI